MKNKHNEFPTLGTKKCHGCKWDQSDIDDEMLFGENLDIITGICFKCRRPYRFWMSKKWKLKDLFEK